VTDRVEAFPRRRCERVAPRAVRAGRGVVLDPAALTRAWGLPSCCATAARWSWRVL